jgi:hypothetical protein
VELRQAQTDIDAFMGRSGPDFSRFLSSEVWIESSGMPLSVVSALARLNLDPPREALRLATLHRAAAAIILAAAIARLPKPPAAIDIPDAAARLIKLLPDMALAELPADAAGTWQPPRAWWIRAARTWQLWLILVLAACVVYVAEQGAPAAGGNAARHPASSVQIAPAERTSR